MKVSFGRFSFFLIAVCILGGALMLSLFYRREQFSLTSNFLSTRYPSSLLQDAGDNASAPPPTTEPSDTSNMVGRWVVGEWSGCSENYDGNVRSVYCVDDKNNPVSDSQCDKSKKPYDRIRYFLIPEENNTHKPITEAEGVIHKEYKLVQYFYRDFESFMSQESLPNIQSVIFDALPVRADAINARHPADGTGEGLPWMTWKSSIKESVVKGETRDFAWYGTPSENLCSGIAEYDLSVVAKLSNGCTAKLKDKDGISVMQNFTFHIRRPSIMITSDSAGKVKFNMRQTSQNIMQKLFRADGKNSITHKVCVTPIGSFPLDWVPSFDEIAEGQYAEFLRSFKSYVNLQMRENLGWEDGGLRGLGKAYIDYYSDFSFCKEHIDPNLGYKIATQKFVDHFNALRVSLFDQEATCWMTKRAKEAVGLTENIAGPYLECINPDCKKSMAQPKSPIQKVVELIKKDPGK